MNGRSRPAKCTAQTLQALAVGGSEDRPVVRFQQKSTEFRHFRFKRDRLGEIGGDHLPLLRTGAQELAAKSGEMAVDFDDDIERPRRMCGVLGQSVLLQPAEVHSVQEGGLNHPAIIPRERDSD